VVAAAALVLLRKTVWGRKVELIGLNATAARFAGVDVDRLAKVSSISTGSWRRSPASSVPDTSGSPTR
jgi:ribose/xylose/arabinose/galactoside ABC-type transport system permease subunit